jgi:Pyruvate/2-oxoacid:ferredoxin oxidoreductase delta subunit
MAVRELVRIDEERCTGCGDCVTACAEGAIQIVDGKARLVSDVYCDGLGACLGHCPEGAIQIERVEARRFDAAAVLRHLAAQRLSSPSAGPMPLAMAAPDACPGSRSMSFGRAPVETVRDGDPTPASELRQWPVQLHLISPAAPHFQGADLLLAADCVAFALGDFHRQHLRGRALTIACPKLDGGQDLYLAKLVSLIDDARIRRLTVVVMEVPCCGGLLRLAQAAATRATRPVPIDSITVGIRGEILAETKAG